MSKETITDRLENTTVAISKLKSEQGTSLTEKKRLNQKLINLESGNFMGDSCPTLAEINDLIEQKLN